MDKNLVQSDEIRLYYKDVLSDLEAGRYLREQQPPYNKPQIRTLNGH